MKEMRKELIIHASGTFHLFAYDNDFTPSEYAASITTVIANFVHQIADVDVEKQEMSLDALFKDARASLQKIIEHSESIEVIELDTEVFRANCKPTN